MRLTAAVIGSSLLLGIGCAAHADPCGAIPDSGPLPPYLAPGTEFSGPVSYIGDGDSLCVALGPTPAEWVEVRIADFYAPELHELGGEQAKAALARIALGKPIVCVAEHRSYDRVVATCSLAGVSIGSRLRAAGVREGGRGR